MRGATTKRSGGGGRRRCKRQSVRTTAGLTRNRLWKKSCRDLIARGKLVAREELAVSGVEVEIREDPGGDEGDGREDWEEAAEETIAEEPA